MGVLMDDRITEIREALYHNDWQLNKGLVASNRVLVAAARAYADLLDSDALIIRRDENGHAVRTNPSQWTRWPEWALDILTKWGAGEAADHHPHAVLDALASSQGVEP